MNRPSHGQAQFQSADVGRTLIEVIATSRCLHDRGTVVPPSSPGELKFDEASFLHTQSVKYEVGFLHDLTALHLLAHSGIYDLKQSAD